MFTDIYKPQTLSKVVGNKKTIDSLVKWISQMQTQQPPQTQIALIHGNSGIGKTLIVELICKEFNFSPVYVDDEINIDSMISVAKIGMNGKKNCIVIEQIDTFDDTFLTNVAKIIGRIQVPILCTSNTNYIVQFKNITNKIEQFKLFNPFPSEIKSFLIPIANRHKIKTSLDTVIENCNKDIRFILNTLNFGGNNFQKDESNLGSFEIAKNIFNMDTSFDNKYKSYCLDPNLMNLFIHENYVGNVYSCTANKPQQLNYLEQSAERLSDADILDNNVDWDLKKYSGTLSIYATDGCNYSKDKTQMKFPEYFKYQNKIKDKKINLSNHLNCLNINNTDNNKSTTNKSTTLKKMQPKQQKKSTAQLTTQPSIKTNDDLDEPKFVIAKINVKKFMNSNSAPIVLTETEVKPTKTQGLNQAQISTEYVCECGAKIQKSSKSSHLKTKKHLELLQLKNNK